MTDMSFTKPAVLAAGVRPPKPPVHAHVSQLDPMKGFRGWEVYVMEYAWLDNWCDDGRGAWVCSAQSTLSTPLQKPGIRPPTMAQRTAALARLGYELDDAAGDVWNREWQWQEGEWAPDRPYLFASITVRPIAPAVTS